jgi:hypothetical protein
MSSNMYELIQISYISISIITCKTLKILPPPPFHYMVKYHQNLG